MTVLGIETATAVCGAAIVADGKVEAEAQVIEKYAHAESIMRLIAEVLRGAEKTIRDVDGVAVSIGPGSFTGLRIGLSVAKGLAYSLDKPTLAVPTLRALAHHAVRSTRVGTPFILSAIDARRNEVYCQLFRVRGGEVEPEGEERDYSVASLVRELRSREITVTGDATGKIRVANPDWQYIEGETAHCSAGAVALLGAHQLRQQDIANTATLEPKYVKEFFTISTS